MPKKIEIREMTESDISQLFCLYIPLREHLKERILERPEIYRKLDTVLQFHRHRYYVVACGDFIAGAFGMVESPREDGESDNSLVVNFRMIPEEEQGNMQEMLLEFAILKCRLAGYNSLSLKTEMDRFGRRVNHIVSLEQSLFRMPDFPADKQCSLSL